MIEKACLQCGRKFKVYPYRKETASFCSFKCLGQYRSNNFSGENSPNWKGGYNIERVCLQCNKKFKTIKWIVKTGRGKFCSKSCGVIYNHIQFKRENWSKKYLKCRKCKTTDNYHEGNGLCVKCYNKKKRYLERYDITVEDYEKRVNLQQGKCLICKQVPIEDKFGRSLGVDHNHETGKIRGLLCTNCNTAIGLMKEDVNNLQAAISYLS